MAGMLSEYVLILVQYFPLQKKIELYTWAKHAACSADTFNADKAFTLFTLLLLSENDIFFYLRLSQRICSFQIIILEKSYFL